MHCLRVLAVLVGLLSATLASAQIDRLVVFGDSLSDVGNINQSTLGAQPGSDYYQGRFSNGPLYIDYVAAELGKPMHHSRDGGLNFAHGGALTSGTGFPSNLFIDDLDDQVGDFLAADSPAADDLLVVWIGGNNIAALTDAGGGSVQPAVDSLIGDLTRLYNAGGRDFLVPNLPPIGKTPRYNQTTRAALADSLAGQFNDALAASLLAFAGSRPDANVFELDIDGLFDKILANPDRFGLTNVTDPAYNGGSTVSNPDQYLFWDDFHPTRVAHEGLGQAAIGALTNLGNRPRRDVPEPAIGGVLVIFLLSLRRRR